MSSLLFTCFFYIPFFYWQSKTKRHEIYGNHIFTVSHNKLPVAAVAHLELYWQLLSSWPCGILATIAQNSSQVLFFGGFNRDMHGSSLLSAFSTRRGWLVSNSTQSSFVPFSSFLLCPNFTRGQKQAANGHYTRCPLTGHIVTPLKVIHNWKARVIHSFLLKCYRPLWQTVFNIMSASSSCGFVY